MKLDNGSFAWNSTGCPSWGTSIVFQTSKNPIKEELAQDIIYGIVHNLIPINISDFQVAIGKGSRWYNGADGFANSTSEPILAGLFNKIEINGIRFEKNFILYITKDKTDGHYGRLQLKYTPRLKYQDIDNEDFFKEIHNVLGIPDNQYWSITDLVIKNQEVLCLTCVSDGINVHEKISSRFDHTLQVIMYGAPGTGKSYKIKTEKLAGVAEENIFRTTFHPDYDYAQFVGCYKPTKDGEKITYSFVPQVFTNAYVKAWKNLEQSVYLVIEEINRGNCAQIFGDLFQLLDRKEDGYSDYPITADEDLKNYLIQELGADSEGIKEGKLCLPPNLNILATMNTSDQSLFPMDSAFKRRWDWEFVPIEYGKENKDGKKLDSFNYQIKIEGKDSEGNEIEKSYNWVDFLKKVNAKILDVTSSEDKQMGNFFVKAYKKDSWEISQKTFVNKVMFYLWNDVCKENYKTTDNFFRYQQDDKDENIEFTFNQLFGDGNTVSNLLIGFMRYLEVEPI